jgi:opacity protein-like surface antigen
VTKTTAIIALWLLTHSALATDITLLAGYQFNTDFEVSTNNGRPPEATPFTSGQPGDDVELEEGATISLAVDFVFSKNPNQRIGFWLSHQNTDFDENAGLLDTEMTVTHLHFTAMSYYPDGKMEPFVIAGVGVGYFEPEDPSLDSETKLSAQIGAGTNYRFTDSLLLRADVRWIPTFFNGGGSAFCSGGCNIKLSSDSYSQVQANIGLMFRF